MGRYIYEPVKPVVLTRFGKLRGVTYGGVNIFMGVKYAQAARFHMPEEQEPWEGVRDAFRYGPITMQMMPPNPPSYYRGLHMLQRQSEDCQNLNIWAPKSEEGAKKPVFVWMHGGGFFAGSAMEEYGFDGFNLAHYGDVVFVSINHRLNILGHLNLADYGEEFENSVNLGIADLVAALKWIHENIAAFGGDPENVTICGHSGGGGKVLCMYQIEEAAPYFQKGICLSGIIEEQSSAHPDDSRMLAEAVLKEAGITKENIGDVYTIPFEKLAEAYRKAARPLWEEGRTVSFGPVRNDYFYGFPADRGFAPYSDQKPLLFGTVMGEFPTVQLTGEEKRAMDQEARIAFIRQRFGEDADHMMDLFRKAYPTHDIIDLAYLDTMFRLPTLKGVAQKVKSGSDNTYVYLGAYNFPEDEWIPMWHGGDVGYMFKNEDMVYVANEEYYGQLMSDTFSSLALQFARTGDPNTSLLPKWEPYTEQNHATMVIDRTSELKADYDTELLELVVKNTPPFRFPLMI